MTWRRPLVCLLAFSVGLLPASGAAAPVCPPAASATAFDQILACQGAADDPTRTAQQRADARLEMLARADRAYTTGATAEAGWALTGGDELVAVATERCSDERTSPPPDQAREILTRCIALIARHMRGLGQHPASSTYATRRQAYQAELDELPAPAPTVQAAAPAAADTDPRAPLPAVPHGLRAGLGAGVALGVVALGAIVGADQWGRGVERAIEGEAGGLSGHVCDDDAAPASCNELRGPRGLLVGGVVSLGVAVALTATFATLLARHARKHRTALPTAFGIGPTRTGFVAGVSLRF